jgi:hypothetical protein
MKILSATFKEGSSEFASSARSRDEEILIQSKQVEIFKEIYSTLNLMPNLILILNRNRQIIFGNTAIEEFARSENSGIFKGLRPGELFFCQHGLNAESGCGTTEACKSCGAMLSILEALDGKVSASECRISRKLASGHSSLDLKIWAKPFIVDKEKYCLVILSDICDEKRRRVLERIFFHDVMNVAGNISNIAKMVKAEILPIQEMIDLLNISADELMDEIRSQKQLLDAENDDLQLNISQISSLSILRKVVSAFSAHEVANDKKIIINEDACDFFFDSDETLLFRVIGNLVKNALEASVVGETVTMNCGKNSLAFWFSCHNSSVIPEKIQLQIFQRSFSTKGNNRGIGSYSVKLIAEKYLGAKVSFISTLGTGTVFKLEFPVKKPE